MTYASDRLYNEVIRRNLARYSSTVKVREILPHLPCLTLNDREDVEAKRENAGNYTAVQLLLDNLRRRENWPDEFIAALRSCEQEKLADEISVAYDRIRGNTNNAAAAPISAPAPPTDSTAAATATVTATVHTVPVTTPPLLTPPSVNAPVQSAAPSTIIAQVPSPPSVPQIPQTQRVEQVNVPAPAPSPVPASQAKIAPAQASPLTVVSPSNVTSTVQQNALPSHIRAPEIKTPILVTPDGQTTTSFTDASVLSTLNAQASSSNTAQSQTTNSCSASEESQLAIPVNETSEKLPVQESNPPFQRPEECSDPTANEIVKRTNTVGMPVKAQTISTAQTTPSAHAEVPPQCSPSISQVYLSKPGILQVPQEDDMQEEPCSIVSSDLEISRTPVPSAEPGQSASLEHPGESLSSTNESSNASLSHNLPEEDHYESVCVSHTETLTNVIHFAEEASGENLNGQPPSMMGNTASTGGVSANLQHSIKNQPALNYENTENAVHLSKPSGRDVIRPSDHNRSTLKQRGEGQGIGQITTLHLTAAAAAVGVGLFLVWKIKH